MDAARPQWPMFSDLLRRQALMEDMMERCGVEMLDVIHTDSGRSFAEARAKCRSCAAVMTCRAWLLTFGGRDTAPVPTFCPNAGLFRTCRKATVERRVRELAALASKLRWIGLDAEATELQDQAARIQREQTIHFGNFLQPSSETD